MRLCFGGKKLFRAQFSLEQNGYQSHEEWKAHWDEARSSEIFNLGSKDETAGNQSCTATIREDGHLDLRLRLPNALAEDNGKYLVIPNVHFKYGHETVIANLQSCQERKSASLETKQNHGQAICYRLKKDKKGWRIFVTTDLEKPKQVTHEQRGTIGIDINVNHIALVETDRFGNLQKKKTFSLSTYGKTQDQTSAGIGDTVAAIVEYAEKAKKPLIIENLDFQKRKSTLRENNNNQYSRMLSSFAYHKFQQTLHSRAWRRGVAVHEVNPAFTSVIGRVKFAYRYGLSIHHAAALCIARRYYGYSEKPPQSSVVITDGKEGQLTLPLPARTRGKHVWSFWGTLSRKIRAALAAHFRAMRSRSSDPPRVGQCDEITPEVVGEIPTREPLAALLG